MERSLGLMAGAGTLPGRAALEARRHGWRVVAFAFEDAPVLATEAMRQTRLLVNNPCEITEADAQRLYEAAW